MTRPEPKQCCARHTIFLCITSGFKPRVTPKNYTVGALLFRSKILDHVEIMVTLDYSLVNTPNGDYVLFYSTYLWNAHRGKIGLIKEDSSEMVAIGENVRLLLKHGATGVNYAHKLIHMSHTIVEK